MTKKIYIKKRKLNKKKLTITIILSTITLVAILTIITVIIDSKQEDILREEMKILSKKDITKETYNTPVKTKGDYAKIEKTIKIYFQNYASNLQSLLKIMDDEKISNVLSIENIKKDGPDFKLTKQYLDNTSKEFNEKLTKLTNMTNEKEIMNQIKKQNLDKYYINLYEELMLRGVVENDFKTSKADLNSASTTINNILNTEKQIIDLLVTNKDKWTVENDKLIFKDTTTLNKYNELKKQLT